eukprot:SAG22_NODE_2137_length_2956_cov_8.564928_1_plen_88_part_00
MLVRLGSPDNRTGHRCLAARLRAAAPAAADAVAREFYAALFPATGGGGGDAAAARLWETELLPMVHTHYGKIVRPPLMFRFLLTLPI